MNCVYKSVRTIPTHQRKKHMEMNRQLTEEQIQMAAEMLKRGSASVIISNANLKLA